MVVVVSHISGFRKTWSLPKLFHISDILEWLSSREGGVHEVILREGRTTLTDDSIVHNDSILTATTRLRGGKGGFGSMLRAIGAQIEKTTNREACRDLSGRRLRDINEEKRLKDYITKKAEKEREDLERKRKKFEQLNDTPKHIFQDEKYYEQKETREQTLHEAIDKIFTSEKVGSEKASKKRSSESNDPQPKKKNRFFDDLNEDSEESESEDPCRSIPVPSTSKDCATVS